jgi:hypothetical protein
MTTPLIPVFATAKIAFGALSLLLPSTVLSLFRLSPVPAPTSTITITRMFGIRDAVLGALLYTADSPAAIRRALIAGMVADGVDGLIAAYGLWNGDLGVLPAELLGGGALVVVGIAGVALRGVGTGVGKI